MAHIFIFRSCARRSCVVYYSPESTVLGSTIAIPHVLCTVLTGAKLCCCGRPLPYQLYNTSYDIGHRCVRMCWQAQIDEDTTCPVCCTDTETGARGRYARKRAAVLPSAYCSAGCACIPIPRNRIQTSIQACFLATQGGATPRCAADKHTGWQR